MIHALQARLVATVRRVYEARNGRPLSYDLLAAILTDAGHPTTRHHAYELGHAADQPRAREMTLAQLFDLALDCPDAVVHALADVLGVSVVAVGEADAVDLRDSPAAIMAHVGELAAEVLTALRDDHVDDVERARLLAKLDRVLATTSAVRARLAGGGK
jgi:hypothetical protein